jgi:glycosyltransferase involved in cell wall biosynthesis
MDIKVSIIVPIYQVEKYLAKCIESILNQSFREFELILVNDGSPDRCGEICEEYVKKDERIKVIYKENGGLSSARNAGLNNAVGKYVGFVDSDDFIHTNMYELLYKKAIETSSDIVLCDYLRVEENISFGNQVCNSEIEIETQSYTNMEALEELFGKNNVKLVIACNKLYKRSLFSDLKFEEGRIHEDEFIAHKLLYKSFKVTYMPIKLYYYLQRDNSIIRSPFTLKQLDYVYALKDRADFFRGFCLINLQHKAEDRYIQSIFSNYKRIKKSNFNAIKEIKGIRKDLFKSIRSLVKNPYYNKKEKALWLLFIFTPLLYDIYVKIKEKNNKILNIKHFS